MVKGAKIPCPLRMLVNRLVLNYVIIARILLEVMCVS